MKIMDARLERAWILGCSGHSDAALEHASGVLADAEAIGDMRLAALSRNDLAWYCFQLGQASLGLEHARKALDYWTTCDEPVFRSRAQAYIGWLLLELGMAEEAVGEAIQALELADLSGDLVARSLATNVIGMIFWCNKQPDRAVLMCEQAVGLAREAGHRTYECWWLINLGGSWSEAGYLAQAEGDHDIASTALNQAIVLTQEALEIARAIGDPWAARICLGNLADYQNHMGDFEAAEASLDTYVIFADNAYVRDRQQYFYTLAQTLSNLGQHQNALTAIQQAVDLVDQGGSFDSHIQIQLYLSQIYERLGSFELALRAHKTFHQLYLRNSAEKTQQRARLAEIFYDTRKIREVAETAKQRAQSLEVSNRRLQERTDELSRTVYFDALTGVHNRLYLDLVLRELEQGRCRYAIAMLDVDHFKAVNDSFSHIVGDKVLVSVARQLDQNLRSDDVAIRYGGEEFALIFRDTDLVSATSTADRLRLALQNFDWGSIGVGLKVTVSIGVATSDHGETPQAILAEADRRLFAAKRQGRNRVVASDVSNMSLNVN